MRPDPKIFAALGDRTRLRLVVRLSRGRPLSITQLASGARITRQAVTKHLRVLASAGIAAPTRSGREQRWSLHHRRLTAARAFLDHLSRQWDDALARLKAHVEDSPD